MINKYRIRELAFFNKIMPIFVVQGIFIPQKYTNKMIRIFFFFFFYLVTFTITAQGMQIDNGEDELELARAIDSIKNKPLELGIDQTDKYLPSLLNRKVAVVCNQTSMKGNEHLVDFLLSKNINVVKIFAPEHGFRGQEDAGEKVGDYVDQKTGIPVRSLYGKEKKPAEQDFVGIDVVVFDIQDVGVRFYTYISTLQFMIEACANYGKPIFVLDRPNPNDHYIDGPILEASQKSFVGLQSIPIVYALTIGEYARLISYEGWLSNMNRPELYVIEMKNYYHSRPYSLPVPPSPNLRSDLAIQYYPILCLFEGTNVSVGRGTNTPFEQYGSPFLDSLVFTHKFIPKPSLGAKSPLFHGKVCYGEQLKPQKLFKLPLSILINAYKNWKLKPEEFFLQNLFFNKLAGNSTLKFQIESNSSEYDIRKTWLYGLKKFNQIRSRYLLYPDFPNNPYN